MSLLSPLYSLSRLRMAKISSASSLSKAKIAAAANPLRSDSFFAEPVNVDSSDGAETQSVPPPVCLSSDKSGEAVNGALSEKASSEPSIVESENDRCKPAEEKPVVAATAARSEAFSVYANTIRHLELAEPVNLQLLIEFCHRMLPVLHDLRQIDRPFVALASMLHAAAKKASRSPALKLQFRDYLSQQKTDAEFLPTWYAAALSCLPNCNSRNLGAMLYAHALIRLQPRADFLYEWYLVAMAKLAEFNEQELSNVIYAFGLLRLTPRRDFLLRWTAVAQRSMAEFTEQGLSNIFYAHALFGQAPLPSFMPYWYHHVKLRLPDFSHQALTNILYGHGLLKLKPDRDFLAAWYFAAQRAIGTFLPHELSNILYAHTLFEEPPPKEFLGHWYNAAEHMIDVFDEQALANALYAHALLSMAPKPSFLRCWYAAADARMAEFSPQGLSNVLYAHALLKLPLNERFSQPWYEVAVQKMSLFDQQAIANVIYAHSLLEVIPPPWFLAPWLKALRVRMPRLDSQSLFNVLWALAKLNILVPHNVYTELLDRITKSLVNPTEEFSVQILSQSIWALAILKLTNHYFHPAAFNACLTRLSNARLNTEQHYVAIHALYLAFKFLREKPTYRLHTLFASLSEEHVDACEIMSGLQRDCASVVKLIAEDYGADVYEEEWNRLIASKVDLVFVRGQKLAVIEVDGPRHYLQPGNVSNPQTLLLTAIMQHANLPVIRIPYFEWRALPNDAEKRFYILERLAYFAII